MAKKSKKIMEEGKIGSWVLISGVLLLVALIVFVALAGKKPAVNTTPSKISTAPTTLPAGLVPEQNVQWQGNYAVPPAAVQPAPTYDSKLSLAQNIANFKSSLSAGGWTISHTANATDKVPFFYATKSDGSAVNITFVVSSAGVKVTVAYSGK